jgi:hypothetical protein
MVTWKDVPGTAPVDHANDAGRRVTFRTCLLTSARTADPLHRLRTPSNWCGVGVNGAESREGLAGFCVGLCRRHGSRARTLQQRSSRSQCRCGAVGQRPCAMQEPVADTRRTPVPVSDQCLLVALPTGQMARLATDQAVRVDSR